MKMSGTDSIVAILVLLGGINWGLIGVFDWNMVEAVLGGAPAVERILYILIGLAALYQIGGLGKARK